MSDRPKPWPWPDHAKLRAERAEKLRKESGQDVRAERGQSTSEMVPGDRPGLQNFPGSDAGDVTGPEATPETAEGVTPATPEGTPVADEDKKSAGEKTAARK